MLWIKEHCDQNPAGNVVHELRYGASIADTKRQHYSLEEKTSPPQAPMTWLVHQKKGERDERKVCGKGTALTAPGEAVQRVLAKTGMLVKEDTSRRREHCRLPGLLLLVGGVAGQELWAPELLSTGAQVWSRAYIQATR